MASGRGRVLWALLPILLGAGTMRGAPPPPPSPSDPSTAPEFVRERCGGCHAVPDPARLPRDLWTETMELMEGVMKEQAGVEYTRQELEEQPKRIIPTAHKTSIDANRLK
jgi:hypothetical protein